MAIDQPRRDPASIEPDTLLGVPAGRELPERAGKGNPSVQCRHGATLDEPKSGNFGREGRKARVQPDRIESHGVLLRAIALYHPVTRVIVETTKEPRMSEARSADGAA